METDALCYCKRINVFLGVLKQATTVWIVVCEQSVCLRKWAFIPHFCDRFCLIVEQLLSSWIILQSPDKSAASTDSNTRMILRREKYLTKKIVRNFVQQIFSNITQNTAFIYEGRTKKLLNEKYIKHVFIHFIPVAKYFIKYTTWNLAETTQSWSSKNGYIHDNDLLKKTLDSISSSKLFSKRLQPAWKELWSGRQIREVITVHF